MTDTHSMTKEALLASLPTVLANDERAFALASAIAGVLANRAREIEETSIYPRIDQLSDALLDLLAYDFKVDWWDANYSISEKRQTLKDSWNIHLRPGTKYAVETALRAIFPNTTVQEWFEYGGKPYTFCLNIDVSGTGVSAEKQNTVLEKVQYYKNARSHLGSVDLRVESDGVFRVGICTKIGAKIEIFPELVTQVELTDGDGTDVKTAVRNTMEIFPEEGGILWQK